MAGPEDFLPPSFWAASISCLFLSSSSICFFLAWASASFLSCSSFLIFSSSALFCAACFFSCSARISFLAACLSFNLFSSASSLERSSLHLLLPHLLLLLLLHLRPRLLHANSPQASTSVRKETCPAAPPATGITLGAGQRKE